MGVSAQNPVYAQPDSPHLSMSYGHIHPKNDKEITHGQSKTQFSREQRQKSQQEHKEQTLKEQKQLKFDETTPTIIISQVQNSVCLAAQNLSKDEYFKIAKQAYHLGNYREAVDNYRKVIELDPEDAKAHNNLGLALKNNYQFEDAIKSYKNAIELDPNFAKAYNNLGSAYKNTKQFTSAIICYKKAIEIDPQYSNAYSNLGNAYKNTNHCDDAILCYRKAIKFNPNNSLVYWNLALALYNNLKFQESIAELKKMKNFFGQTSGKFKDLETIIGNVNDYSYLQEVLGFLEYALHNDSYGADFREKIVKLKGQVAEKIR